MILDIMLNPNKENKYYTKSDLMYALPPCTTNSLIIFSASNVLCATFLALTMSFYSLKEHI